jgi:hypothetical protein
MTGSAHVCRRFWNLRREGPWQDVGRLKERSIERVALCAECHRERPARVLRVIAVEREGAGGRHAPPDPLLRRHAERLLSRARGKDSLRAGPLLRAMGGVLGEGVLESLAEHVPIRLVYKNRSGSLHLDAVRVLDAANLEEFARPGAADRRASVLDEARKGTSHIRRPEALALTEILRGDAASRMDERLVRALAGLIRLVEGGAVRSARAFSAEVLGDSKAIASLRPRLERLVGPLERLGVRDMDAMVVFGGAGVLDLPRGTVDLGRSQFMGLAASDVERLSRIQAPPGGLLIVENLAPFQACAARVHGHSPLLLLWSAGFPGPALVHLVRQVASQGLPVRVWCDLDLGGIRIARVLQRAAPETWTTVLMDPQTVESASGGRPLSKVQRADIERDLELNPDAPLTGTLAALLARDVWIEQETLMGRIGSIFEAVTP